MLERLFLGEAEAHTALFACVLLNEFALAAAAGVDLGFHHPERAGERVDRLLRVIDREHRDAIRQRDAELAQHILGLMLVNVHGTPPLAEMTLTAPLLGD